MDLRADAGLIGSMVQVKGLFIAALAHTLSAMPTLAQDSKSFAPEQIRLGAEIFSRNCSPCHGPRMQDPEGAFDLRTFPPDQHARFVNSVSQGKNSMPPWAGLLMPKEIEALWAYVMAGEKHD
jgi:mono/diheme cytochrome c family protein